MIVACLLSVSTDKWQARWGEQHRTHRLTFDRYSDQPEARAEVIARLEAGEFDAAIVRVYPGEEAKILGSLPLHAVTLYDENQAVLLTKDHPFAEESEIAGELIDDLELRSALLPAPVARDALQKDLVAVPVTGLEPSRVVCVWLVSRDDDDVQDFIGLLRGRTGRSSRIQAD